MGKFRYLKRRDNHYRLTKAEQEYVYNYINNNRDIWEQLDIAIKNADYREGLYNYCMGKIREKVPTRIEAVFYYNITKYIEAIKSGEISL